MSIREAVIERLKRAGIHFESVKVDKDATNHGNDANAVEVVRKDGGTKMNYTITFDKKNNMDADHIADVVLSYMTHGKNRWVR